MATNVTNKISRFMNSSNDWRPNELSAIRSVLEAMLDPITRSIVNAAVEEEARASIERARALSHEGVLREFGLKPRG